MAASTHHESYRLFLSCLREARTSAGITQIELAQRIRNTQTFVSKVERGERRLDFVEAVEMCEAIGVSPLAFMKKYLSDRGLSRKKTDKLAKGI